MTRLTDEQISELERMEREATEACGPLWVAKAGPDPDGHDEPWLATPEHDDGYGGVSASIVGLDMSTENAALAAAMRSALPALLAEVRASRASPPPPEERTELRAALERFLSIADAVKRASDERRDRAVRAQKAAALARAGKRDEALRAMRVLDASPTVWDFSRTVGDLEEAAVYGRAALTAAPPPAEARIACDRCGGGAPFWVHGRTAERLCFGCVQRHDGDAQQAYTACDLTAGAFRGASPRSPAPGTAPHVCTDDCRGEDHSAIGKGDRRG